MKKAKHFLSFLLTLALVLTALPMTALPAGAAASEDFTYSVISETNKTCSITKYIGTATELEIPSVLDGYTVTEIGFNAFYECTALTSVTIPDSVTSICDFAFAGCASLTSVTIPDSVKNISEFAFGACTALTSIKIPSSVITIEQRVFAGCISLECISVDENNPIYTSVDGVLFDKSETILVAFPGGADTKYTIPNGVTHISEGAFYACTSLTSITFPNSVTSIGKVAFGFCTSLTNITISDSVTSIGSEAFEDTAYYNTESNWDNDVLYIGNYLIKAKDTIGNVYAVKDGTKTIADRAFFYCTSLISIIIPDGLTSIGNSAFSNCKSLTNITISDSVTSIGSEAFEDTAYYNTESNWDNDVLYIGNYLIKAKDTIGNVYAVKDGTKTIADTAFFYRTSLISIIIPDGLTSIGNSAFSNCKSLTNITIPNSVTSIGSAAFSWCTSLISIIIPDGLTSIGDYAFSDCRSLTNITIPNSVTSIGRAAFSFCTSLTAIYGFADSYAETYANENRYTFVPLKTLGDAETNIVLVLPSDSISSESTVLNVEKCAVEETAVTYDITLTVDGEITQPTSAATVKMPVSAETGGAQYKVYRQEANGGYTDMCATYQNGYMVFTTDHFSTYVLLNTTLCTQGDMNGDASMTISDYAVMADIAIGKQTPTVQNMYCGDLNRDSVVDFFDVSLLDLVLSGNYTLEEITN